MNVPGAGVVKGLKWRDTRRSAFTGLRHSSGGPPRQAVRHRSIGTRAASPPPRQRRGRALGRRAEQGDQHQDARVHVQANQPRRHLHPDSGSPRRVESAQHSRCRMQSELTARIGRLRRPWCPCPLAFPARTTLQPAVSSAARWMPGSRSGARTRAWAKKGRRRVTRSPRARRRGGPPGSRWWQRPGQGAGRRAG